jgi:serine/threonine-protein kinase
MGAVYRAVDTMVERQAAIKVLKPDIASDPEVAERFHTEAVTLARLNHPSIATLYSFFRVGDEFFMAMEFVPGPTLSQMLRAHGALDWRPAAELMIELLEALQHAHTLGVLHRDIKTSNIILPPGGGLKVTDFGIARLLGAAGLTREGRVVGTLEYMAPERIQGLPFDERSDLYSAGIVFYRMLSGRLPFRGDSDLALISAQVEQAPPPLAQFGVEVPAGVELVMRTSLEKDPANRYPNAAAMAAALRTAIAEAPGPRATVFPQPAALDRRPGATGSSTAETVPAAPPVFAPVKDSAVYPQAAVAAPPLMPEGLPAAAAARRISPLWIGLAAGVLLAGAGVGAWALFSKSSSRESTQASTASTVANQAAPAASPDVAAPAPTPASTPDPGPTTDRTPSPPVRRGQPPVSSAPQTAPAIPQSEPATAPPAPAPSEPAPRPATSRVIESIIDVRTLMIAKMPDQIDDFVRDELLKQLRNRIRVVTRPEEADAVMQCSVEEGQGGNAVTNTTGHVLGVKGRKSATFKIFDRTGKRVLWQEEVSDKRGILHLRVDSNEKLAERIVGKLKKDLK